MNAALCDFSICGALENTYYLLTYLLMACLHRQQNSFVLSRLSFDEFCLVRVSGVNKSLGYLKIA